MKTFAEASSLAAQRMQNTSTGAEIVAPTVQLGSTPGGGLTITAAPKRPQAAELPGIALKAHLLLLSRIKRETPDPENLDVLKYLNITVTYEEAATWIARLLAHFPRREITKDAIIISDTAGDLVQADISLVAVVAVCDDIRRAANDEHPFPPLAGEVLKQAKAKMETYRLVKERFSNV